MKHAWFDCGLLRLFNSYARALYDCFENYMVFL